MRIGSSAFYLLPRTDPERELKTIRAALQIAPDSGELHLCFAAWLHTNGDIAPALREYETAITLLELPTDTKTAPEQSLCLTHWLMGRCYAEDHQFENAKQHWQKVIELFETFPECQRRSFQAYRQAKSGFRRLAKKAKSLNL